MSKYYIVFVSGGRNKMEVQIGDYEVESPQAALLEAARDFADNPTHAGEYYRSRTAIMQVDDLRKQVEEEKNAIQNKV